MCIRDLRERVANGGDPTKLHEAPVEHDDDPIDEQGIQSISVFFFFKVKTVQFFLLPEW